MVGLLPVSYGNFSFDFRVKQFLRGVKSPRAHRLWRWLGSFVPEELAGLLEPEAFPAVDCGTLYAEIERLHNHVAHFDTTTRDGYIFARTYLADGVLAKVDRATMACALEARSPLLDHEFVTLACTVPSRLKYAHGRTKYILRKALEGWLPEDILRRPKKGFGIPIGDWFRGRLREALQDTLHERRIREGGFLRPAAVRKLVDDHLSGKRDNRKPLWTLFMFERWREQWLKNQDAPRVGAAVQESLTAVASG
ncbi:MAG: asparagine synthase C-terminal domain-containing protein [Planctomycetota bacterium]